MSIRLALLRRVMRWVVKPSLRRETDVLAARRRLRRLARWQRIAPHVCSLPATYDGVACRSVRCRERSPKRIIFYIHGGAYCMGDEMVYEPLMARIARLTGAEVVAPLYRLAPEHPFPAALEDCRAAYNGLLAKGYAPQDIMIGSDSAGGGLALALLATFPVQKLPAGLFAFSPWTDMTMSGESLASNAVRDDLIPVSRFDEAIDQYLGTTTRTDPRASPLFASYADPPPVLIQVGSTEVLYDDAVRMEETLRAAGGTVRLEVFEHAPHVWQMLDGYVPEARTALISMAEFVQTSFESARR